jgi:hypothetical protein
MDERPINMDKLGDTPGENQQNSNVSQVFSNERKLWNPKSFIWMSVFFSFLPSAILYSLNYGRLGNTKKRNIYLVTSIFMFAIMISLGIFIEVSALKTLFYGLNIGLGIYMRKDQLAAYNEHILNGGKKASSIIPVLACVAILAFGIWGIIYSANIPDKMLQINGDELYYTDNIKIDEVKKIGEYLENNGILVNDDNSISVKIDKKSDVFVFSIVMKKEYINDKETVEFFKSLAQQLSTDLFYSKVEVQLCDNRFNVLKVIDN